MMELAPVIGIGFHIPQTRKSLSQDTVGFRHPGPREGPGTAPPLYRGVQAGSMSSFMGGKLK